MQVQAVIVQAMIRMHGEKGTQLFNSTEASPILVLLSSTVTSPNVVVSDVNDLQLNDRTSLRTIVRTSNLTRNETSKVDTIDEILIPTNHSMNIAKGEKDDSVSNVSSEVSINRDIVLETTLLDVTTDKLRSSIKIPEATRTSNTEDIDEDLEELLKGEGLETTPSSAEFLLYDLGTRDVYTEEGPITGIN